MRGLQDTAGQSPGRGHTLGTLHWGDPGARSFIRTRDAFPKGMRKQLEALAHLPVEARSKRKPEAATRPGRAPPFTPRLGEPPHPQAGGAIRDPNDACPEKPLLRQSPIPLLRPHPGRPLPLSACCPAAPSALQRWGDPVSSADPQGITATLGP